MHDRPDHAWDIRRLLLLALSAVALLAVAALVGPAPAATGAPQDPQVRWHPCGEGFECATARVPLDHDDPRGAIQLRLIRLPASGPEGERVGSLFTNFGGPGGPGVPEVRAVGHAFPEPIRQHFDIVGFDPRGIQGSTPLRCYGAVRQALEAQAPFPFPIAPREEELQEDIDADVAEACDRRGGRILDHMSTANVARDMDVLREAVGDDELHFLGFSYGSQLGITYANLFPANVGRMVLDGVLDPVAFTTGEGQEAESVPVTARIGSDQGAADTAEEFFRLCDEAGRPQQPGGPGCALAPDSEDALLQLADRLRKTPVELALPDGETLLLTEAVLFAQFLGALYGPETWPLFAQELANLIELVGLEAGADELGEQYAQLQQAAEDRRGVPTYPGSLGFPGVLCLDSDNPGDYGAWPAVAGQRAGDLGDLGAFARLWTWSSSLCNVWPGQDDGRYAPHPDDDPDGWTAPGADVLLVTSRFDPATPFSGADAAHDLLDGSQLLTYEGWGHVSLMRSGCATAHAAEYLVAGEVAGGQDVVCQPEGLEVPFSAPLPE